MGGSAARPQLAKQALSRAEVTTIAVAAVSGLLFGYDLCVIAGALGPLEAEFALGTAEKQAVVSSVLGSAVVGSVLGGLQAEVHGRKPAIVVFTLLFAAGAVVMAAAPSFGVLLLGRVLVGLAVGGSGMSVVRGGAVAPDSVTPLRVTPHRPPRPTQPVYLAELAPASWRGLVVATNEVMICLGCLVALVVDAAFADVTDGWRVMLGFGAVPACLQLIGPPRGQCPRRVRPWPLTHPNTGLIPLPRSPRWLLLRNRDKEAELALASLRGVAVTAPVLREELGVLLAAVGRLAPHTAPKAAPSHLDAGAVPGEETEDADDGKKAGGDQATPAHAPPSWLDLLGWSDFRAALRTRGARWQFALALCAAVAQNLSAANAMLYYSGEILEAAAGEGQAGRAMTERCVRPQPGCLAHFLPSPPLPYSPTLRSVGVGLAKFFGVCASLLIISRYGRKRILAAGTGAMLACHVALALVFTLPPGSGREAGAATVLLLFIFAWDLSWAPLMWVVCSELLPARGRAMGMGLAIGSFWLSGALVNQFLLSLAAAVGWSGAFLTFAALSTLGLLFVGAVLPETAGLSLEAIAAGFDVWAKRSGQAPPVRGRCVHVMQRLCPCLPLLGLQPLPSGDELLDGADDYFSGSEAEEEGGRDGAKALHNAL